MVQIFLDSAILEEIKSLKNIGLLDGVTTNPSLIKKAVDQLKKQNKKISIEIYIRKILETCNKKPVSLEVIGTNLKEMVEEGETLYKKFKKYGNVYIKIPVNPCMEDKCTLGSDGIKAIKELSKNKIPVNCTLIFTPEQALLAAKAGAKFVSPFMGREDDYIREINRVKFKKEDYFPKEGYKKEKKTLEDNGIISGIDLIKKTIEIFKKNKIRSKVLAASIRSSRQFREALKAGADIVTLPYKIIIESLNHQKTIEGMKKFTKDIVPEYARLIKKNENSKYK
ncbi:transaldolase [Candidatus Pacearchaeota archaeon]|nr:transaldolase [Candidatus Pacearchaeota archaeon]